MPTVTCNYMGKKILSSTTAAITRMIEHYHTDNKYMGYVANTEGFNNWLYASSYTLNPNPTTVYLR